VYNSTSTGARVGVWELLPETARATIIAAPMSAFITSDPPNLTTNGVRCHARLVDRYTTPRLTSDD
jgi:hypothetical protein